jgi:hypothetical protein
LLTRAMYRTGQGELDKAWDDLTACHRLARRIGEGAFLVELLVATAIDGIGTFGDVALAHYGKPSMEQVKQFQASISKLGRVSSVAGKLALGERYSLLDTTAYLAREGQFNALMKVIDFFESLSSTKKQQPRKKSVAPANLQLSIDWDIPAKYVNQWMDRLTTVEEIADPRVRVIALDKFNQDHTRLALEIKRDPFEFGQELFGKAVSKENGGAIIGKIVVSLFLPASSASARAIHRTELDREMLRVVFALAAFRSENGHYPDRLETLVPKYIAKVPDDIFRSEPAPINYRRDGDAYTIWSVHVNGIDEKGATYDDDPSGDDWVLRPVPRETK